MGSCSAVRAGLSIAQAIALSLFGIGYMCRGSDGNGFECFHLAMAIVTLPSVFPSLLLSGGIWVSRPSWGR